MNNLIQIKDLKKKYRRGSEEVHALRGVTFTVGEGEFLSLTGPSGSGKTTLLQLIGCMDRPSEGEIYFDESMVNGYSEAALSRFRAKTIGFVFQQFFLIPTLSALENVEIPAMFLGSRDRKQRAMELLEKVGLADRMSHRPSELSGGEMQRVAIARALINRPRLLLADEPTGNLDSENAAVILALLQKLQRDGLTILMVTHNMELASAAKKIVRIKDGMVEGKI